jgi:hypothetical protein
VITKLNYYPIKASAESESTPQLAQNLVSTTAVVQIKETRYPKFIVEMYEEGSARWLSGKNDTGSLTWTETYEYTPGSIFKVYAITSVTSRIRFAWANHDAHVEKRQKSADLAEIMTHFIALQEAPVEEQSLELDSWIKTAQSCDDDLCQSRIPLDNYEAAVALWREDIRNSLRMSVLVISMTTSTRGALIWWRF